MGETGCGKTKLIRYMCRLTRQGDNFENMLALKVMWLQYDNCVCVLGCDGVCKFVCEQLNFEKTWL